MRSIKEMDKRLDEREQEIERQKEVINGMIDNEEKYLLEINKLKSIIKEVREYAEEIIDFVGDVSWVEIRSEDYIKKWQDILEILDKENK